MANNVFWMYNEVEQQRPLTKTDTLRSLFFKGQGVQITETGEYGVVAQVGEEGVIVKVATGSYKVLPFSEVTIALATQPERDGNG